MGTRSAEATIKGYYYQFDTSIMKLLDLEKSTDSITVEGIEDIDISSATENTAIQCKYLSKPKFTDSSIRKPIILMLEHFADPLTSNNYNYVLYAHFENESPGSEPKIDFNRLKKILTYKENKVLQSYHLTKGLSNVQLSKFLNQFKLVFGKEFYQQQAEVLGKLKSRFNCSEFEADAFYYNNALRIVIDKSIKNKGSQREISQREFIDGIDCKKELFNEWFIKLRSKSEYLKKAIVNLKSIQVLKASKSKLIFIGKELLDANNSAFSLQSLIENLVERYYKQGAALRDAKPLMMVVDGSQVEMNEIKSALIKGGINFNDGFETISFSSSHFNQEPITNTNKTGNKITKSSFSLKLISKSNFLSNLSDIQIPNIVFNFSLEDLPVEQMGGQYFDFKYCETLSDINKLLVP